MFITGVKNKLKSVSAQKHSLLPVLVVAIFLLQACVAGGVLRQVNEEQKDPTFSYDGQYIATIKHPGGEQSMGQNWHMNCNAVDYRVQINIDKSVVSWTVDGKTAKSFVDKDGRFRVEAPIDQKFEVINGTASDDEVWLVLEGVVSADVMKGRYVYAVGQFNGRGCSYRVNYAPAG